MIRVLWPETEEERAYVDGFYRLRGGCHVSPGDEVNVGGHAFRPTRTGLVIGVHVLCGHPVRLVYANGVTLAPEGLAEGG